MSSFYKRTYCRNCRAMRTHGFYDEGANYEMECLTCHIETPERRFYREMERVDKRFEKFRRDYVNNHKL